jgi:hypothetical protein
LFVTPFCAENKKVKPISTVTTMTSMMKLQTRAQTPSEVAPLPLGGSPLASIF